MKTKHKQATLSKSECLQHWNTQRNVVFKGKPLTQKQEQQSEKKDINPLGLFTQNMAWNRNESLDYIDKMINIINATPENEFA